MLVAVLRFFRFLVREMQAEGGLVLWFSPITGLSYLAFWYPVLYVTNCFSDYALIARCPMHTLSPSNIWFRFERVLHPLVLLPTAKLCLKQKKTISGFSLLLNRLVTSASWPCLRHLLMRRAAPGTLLLINSLLSALWACNWVIT